MDQRETEGPHVFEALPQLQGCRQGAAAGGNLGVQQAEQW